MADNAADDGSVAGIVEDNALDFASSQVATFCNQLADARIRIVVAALARGKSQKQAAAEAGVDRITLYRWCQQHPEIEQMAAMEADALARPPLLRLSANLDAAVDVLCAHTKGEVDGDIEVERLRQSAAKTTLGLLVKLIDRAAERRGEVVTTGSSKARELSTAELIERARELRRLQKGG